MPTGGLDSPISGGSSAGGGGLNGPTGGSVAPAKKDQGIFGLKKGSLAERVLSNMGGKSSVSNQGPQKVLETRPGKALMNVLGVGSEIVQAQLGFSDLDSSASEPAAWNPVRYRPGHQYGIRGGGGGKIAANIGLDIALDPLTYVSGGVGAGAKAAQTELRVTEAGMALAEASKVRKLTTIEKVGAEGLLAAGRAADEGAQFAKPGLLGRLRGTEGVDQAVARQVDALSQTGRGGLRLRLPLADKSVTLLRGDQIGAVGDAVRRLPGVDTLEQATRARFVNRIGTADTAGQYAADALGEAHFGGEAKAEMAFTDRAQPIVQGWNKLDETERGLATAHIETGATIPVDMPHVQEVADRLKAIHQVPVAPSSKLREVPVQAEVLSRRSERLAAQADRLTARTAISTDTKVNRLEEQAASLLSRSHAAVSEKTAAALEERAAQATSDANALRKAAPPAKVRDLQARAAAATADADALQAARTAQRASQADPVLSATPRLATPQGQSVLRELETRQKLTGPQEELKALLSNSRGADAFAPELTTADANARAVDLVQQVAPDLAGKLKGQLLEPDVAKALLHRDLQTERASQQVAGLEEFSRKIKAPDGSDLMHFGTAETAPENFAKVKFGDQEVFVHPGMAKDVEQTAKTMNSNEYVSKLTTAYDTVLNQWRAANTVLPLGTGFFGRNALGNVVLASLKRGMGVNDWVKGLDVALGRTEEGVKIRQIMKERKLYNMGAGEADLLKPELLNTLGESKLRTAARKLSPVEFGRKLNAAIENQARAAVFVAGLRETGSATQAAMDVRKYLFEYSDLTPFERSTMRRVVPFYTFARKNTALMLRTAVTDPGRLNAVNRIVGGIEEGAGVSLDSPAYAAGDTLLSPGIPLAGQNTLFSGGIAGAVKGQLSGKAIPDSQNPGAYRQVLPGQGVGGKILPLPGSPHSGGRIDTALGDIIPLYGKYGRLARAGALSGLTQNGDKKDLLKFFTGIGSNSKTPTPAKGNTNVSLSKAAKGGL